MRHIPHERARNLLRRFSGAGVFADYTECGRAMVRSEKLELPDKSMFEFYREKDARYRELLGLVLQS